MPKSKKAISQFENFPIEQRMINVGKRKLPTLLIDMPALSSVTVLLLANTGSRYESFAEEGLAHFFEHMVFKGTKLYPEAKQLSEALDSVGADFNAFTSKEYTGYYVKAASQYFPLALDILSDMLLQPQLRQVDIDRETGVIIEELNMYADMPSHQVASIFEEMSYAERGLAHDIVGRKESIQSFQTKDFRSFLNRFYGLENLQLVVAGGLSKIQLDPKRQKLKNRQEDIFSYLEEKFNKGAFAQRQEGKQKAASAQSDVNAKAFSKERLRFQWKKTEQAHFILGWPALDMHHPDRYAQTLLANILGGTMSSRLFTEIREKRGLAYYVRASSDMNHDSGLLSCSAGVDLRRVEEAIKVAKFVFEDLASGKEKISNEEFIRAKNYVKGKLLLGLEESNSVAQFFGLRQLLSDELITLEELADRYEKIQKEEVQALAEKIIQDQDWRFAMVSGRKDTEKIQAVLQE